MHWYDADGNPAYEVVGANGNTRPTTLRDARKLQLVPSVTTVMSVLGKPGLDMWKQEQLFAALENNPRKLSMGFPEWKARILHESGSKSKHAAQRGTDLHDLLETYFKTGEITKDKAYIQPVVDLLKREFPNTVWQSEISFCDVRGFGGKIDLCSVSRDIVLDFKTKSTADIKKMIPYDEHHMQTAAYAAGLGSPTADRYNLFISTEEPGLLNITASEDFERDWGMFKHTLKYWQYKNKYVPFMEDQ